MWCGFLIIKLQTALHHAMQCTITYGTVRLCHFSCGVGAVLTICVVWFQWQSHLMTKGGLAPPKKFEFFF